MINKQYDPNDPFLIILSYNLFKIAIIIMVGIIFKKRVFSLTRSTKL